MVSADPYDDTRQATIDHVGGVLELIEPLEADGTLVRRSRDKLEREIDRFLVMERDGTVIACAALYPFGNDGGVEHCLNVTNARDWNDNVCDGVGPGFVCQYEMTGNN